jgi:two-component system osmolarity sensor histidine kinase EnvZ
VHDAISRGCPPPCADTSGPFGRGMCGVLLPGSHVVSDSANGTVWVRYPSAPYWITMPCVEPAARRNLALHWLYIRAGKQRR